MLLVLIIIFYVIARFYFCPTIESDEVL